MVTPVALTDAIPLLTNPDGAGLNTAQDVRLGMLAPLFLPGDVGNEFGVRSGVLNRGTTTPSMKVRQNGTADRNVIINGGTAVIHRSGQGPYLCYMLNSATTLLLDLSDATNPRVDAVVARVYDKNIAADTGAPAHGPLYDAISGVPNASVNLNGTPGSAGAPPVIPEGCIPLAYVTRAAGSPGNTIVDANITDKRRAAALFGSTRVLLPGDSTAEAGIVHGERRGRNVGSLYLEDYWSTTDSKWHGTREVTFSFTPVSGSGTPAVPTASPGLTYGSLTIPDLGYDYKVRFGAHAQVFNLNSDSAAVVAIHDGSAAGTIVASGSDISRNGLDAGPSIPGHREISISAGVSKTYVMTIQAVGDQGSINWANTFENGGVAVVAPA